MSAAYQAAFQADQVLQSPPSQKATGALMRQEQVPSDNPQRSGSLAEQAQVSPGNLATDGLRGGKQNPSENP